jgi:hypothetical protein
MLNIAGHSKGGAAGGTRFTAGYFIYALTHCVSTTFIEYRCQPPPLEGGCSHPAVQLNSIFSPKTDPRENPCIYCNIVNVKRFPNSFVMCI